VKPKSQHNQKKCRNLNKLKQLLPGKEKRVVDPEAVKAGLIKMKIVRDHVETEIKIILEIQNKEGVMPIITKVKNYIKTILLTYLTKSEIYIGNI
jgi:hypothetical protein